MTKHTGRDDVWDHALRLALDEECFKLQRVRDAASEELSDRTIRDTLNTMTDKGWLSKQTPQSHEWNPGPRCRGEEPDARTDAVRISRGVVLEPGKVYIGKVDRISNNRNVLVSAGSTSSEFINIGSVKNRKRGQEVEFEYVLGKHGRCTEDKYIADNYSHPSKESANRTNRDSFTVTSKPSLSTLASSNSGSSNSSSSSSSKRVRSSSTSSSGPGDPDNKNKLINGHM